MNIALLNEIISFLQQIGQALTDDGHYASKDITDTLNKLNYQWADLYERARDKVSST